MTEEDEHVLRQVASDINEQAFFGKQMKKINSAQTNPEMMLSPRSQEVFEVMKRIQSTFG